ncbi:MAG: amidohydrolase [Sphingomonadaceae bacterium]|nr:amidohydrolase [Sphingomonadaceae bacterium]
MERPIEDRDLGYPVYDADGHLYETMDTFRRHLPKKFHKDFQYVTVNGRTKLAIKGHISEWIPNPTFEVVAAPGSHEKWFRADNPDGLSIREMTGDPLRFQPEFAEPVSRLKLLDEQNVHGQLIFPTLASVIEGHMGKDVELMAACVHSLNAWVADEWTFNYKDRIFPCGYISLADADAAEKELDFCLKNGARHILVRPAPVPGALHTRSPGLPEFDRFWAKVAESGIFVVLHCSDSGYDEIYQWWNGGGGQVAFDRADPLKACMDGLTRAIQDMLMALICHGVMDRHPNIRWVSAENGSTFVRSLTHILKRAYGQMPQAFARDPLEHFHEKVYVAPFYEENVNELAKLMSPDRLLFGSDWPHAEGVAKPLDYIGDVQDFSPADQQKFMSSNLKGLLEGKR